MVTGRWVGNDSASYQTGFPREGAIEVRADEAQRDDIVMIGATDESFPLHAAIIWAPVSGQRFQVIDSNFAPDEKVRFGTLLIPTYESHIWRMGQVPVVDLTAFEATHPANIDARVFVDTDNRKAVEASPRHMQPPKSYPLRS